MNELKKDIEQMQGLTQGIVRQTESLAALAGQDMPAPENLQKHLELISGRFEHSAIAMRKLCEKHCPGAGGYGSFPELPRMEIAGSVEQFGYGWLHIQLKTLLPTAATGHRNGSAIPSAACWTTMRRVGVNCLSTARPCW